MKRKHWIYELVDDSRDLPHDSQETTEAVKRMLNVIKTSGLSSKQVEALGAYMKSVGNLSTVECIEFLRNYYYDRNEEKE